MEGYPSGVSIDFKEANVHDLIVDVIGPIISEFTHLTGRKVLPRGEKELTGADSQTADYQEFVIIENKSPREESLVLAIKAKRSSLGDGIRQSESSIKYRIGKIPATSETSK